MPPWTRSPCLYRRKRRAVRERIARAAARVGRSPESVTLMAVSKTVEPERIREAYAAGIRVFGENRVQEFAEKARGAQRTSKTPSGI